MIIKKLYLENFLSYEREYADFAPGLNVISGKNAAGKTNLLESIYYAAVGKSARGMKDKELLRWESQTPARIRILVAKKYAEHTVDLTVDRQGKKRIAVDSLPISKLGELIGAVNIVFFSPDEMKLIKESPADRRRFMDISLSQQSKTYFYTLLKYNKLLQQRNKVLKNYRTSARLKEMVDLVTAEMLEAQVYLIGKRKEFLERLNPVAREEHRFLTNGTEELVLGYETEEVDFSDIAGSLRRLYEENYEKDCRLEYTTVGVHRDDIKITADGVDIRKFGSQGQQRTSVLSLKLAEIAMFREVTGEYPVLLLDDVLSELDEDRRRALFERIEGVQIFVTCTEFEETVNTEFRLFLVEHKKLKKLN